MAVVFLLGISAFILMRKPGDFSSKTSWGVTFSKYFAQKSGLDWQEAYLAILDELDPEAVRIVIYWPDAEPEQGSYDFSSYDWMVEEAQKRDKKMVIVIGQKVPRWPECHIPDWARSQGKEQYQESLLAFMRQAVLRYKDRENLYLWQVENEPFLDFGQCEKLDVSLLDKEIAMVRSLDSEHKIMVTDSGELSIWLWAAKRADIFGTTVYRIIWSEKLGYFKYPWPVRIFWLKAGLVRFFYPDKPIIVCEMQGEYWGPKQPYETPLELEMREFGILEFRAAAGYTKKIGFSEVYLWGAEWWYWLGKKHGNWTFWQEAQEIIKNK